MLDHETTAIILAAGLGTRMKSSRPKAMHSIAGRPMINLLISSILDAGIEDIVTVIGKGMEEVQNTVFPYKTIIQEKRLGTGHAALEAVKKIKNLNKNIMVFNCDTPIISAQTIQDLGHALKHDPDTKIAILGFRSANPGVYGRLLLNSEGGIERIIEAKDASPNELSINLCSAGIMNISSDVILNLLKKIKNNNSQNEFYLSDIVKIAKSYGIKCCMIEGPESQLLGINSRSELAEAELVFQKQLRTKAMAEGATLIDPQTVWFNWDTKLGRDVMIEPNVFFGPDVEVGNNVEIRSFSYIAGTKVGNNSTIGPFARLRPESTIKEGGRIGNFVEIKNANIGENAKLNHLSYVGDATVGTRGNIGAGTITCNYNGVFKSKTFIGDDAFIGSNTSLVAPVTIGSGAIVGAGSVITEDVEANALALERADLRKIKDGARRQRNRLVSSNKARGKS